MHDEGLSRLLWVSKGEVGLGTADSLVIFLTSMNLRMKWESVKRSSNIFSALMWKTLFR